MTPQAIRSIAMPPMLLSPEVPWSIRAVLSLPALVPGKRIGGGHQISGAVRTYLKRSQVAAFGLPGVSGRLVVTARRQEIAGRTAGGSNRVRLTPADLVDVHGVETGRQDSRGNRLHGDGGKPLVKSKVAVATSRPSAVFRCAVSDPAPGAGLFVADDPGEPLLTGGVVPGACSDAEANCMRSRPPREAPARGWQRRRVWS